MPQIRILLCLGTALFLLAGCNPEDMIKKVATDEDQQGATQCIEALRARRFEAILTHLDPELRNNDTRQTLERMAGMLPPGQPDAIKLIGADVQNSSEGARTANLTYQYTFGKRYFMLNCATLTERDSRSIVGLNVRELDFPIEEQAGFKLADKSAAHYGMLAAAIVVLLLSLTALILCILEKSLPRKWLWIVFILFGVGKLSLNWNSGSWEFHPASLLLFSASALSRGYGGWVISVALPLGATVYLIRRFLNHRAPARSNTGG